MADLNSTIVRGKLRVTEDINTNGNIVGSSIIGSGSGLTNLNASNISSGTLSADRHYSPTADKGSELTAKGSETANAYAKDTEYTVLTGVTAQRDAKGHVTGLTCTAQKIKDTNTTYTFNGAVSTIKDSNLTASRALISDNSGKIAVSDVTSAELSYLDGVTSSIQTQLNAKLDKTTYEWNKEFKAGSNGAISLGRYNVYDSQLTFDITSTTNQSLSGKLVIATQNGTIHQAKVFGDASGTLVSKLIIYQSAISNSRSWVEVFCNFNGWSKNKVHVYAVALNSATVQKQMTSVTISNGVPAAANVTSGDTKWTGTIVNDFSHSHGISIKEASSGTSKLTLAHGTKYELTAGGQSFIFTTPSDTNTWRGIQDNLTSTSTTDSLSANQGRVLKGLVDSKVNSSDLVELTLTPNGTKHYLIGSALANTWSDIGTDPGCYTQSGSLYAKYFYGTSDRRLKENIKDLDLNCLDLVNNINLREFSWKADKEHKPTIGAVAQELRQVLPEKYVHEFIGGQETDDEYLSINDSKLVYLLIGAIQEQQKEIENLKAKIDGKTI